MKVCPVCKTTLFEDMEVCYGCMYRFGSNPDLEKQIADQANQTGNFGNADKLNNNNKLNNSNKSFDDTEQNPRAITDESFEKDLEKNDAKSLTQGSGNSCFYGKDKTVQGKSPWIVRLEVRYGDRSDQIWSIEAALPLKATQPVSALLTSEQEG